MLAGQYEDDELWNMMGHSVQSILITIDLLAQPEDFAFGPFRGTNKFKLTKKKHYEQQVHRNFFRDI